MQRKLAEEVTVMVHGRDEYDKAVEASRILFGNATDEALRNLDEKTFLEVFEGVPTFNVSKEELEAGIPLLEFLAVKTGVFPSKGEARKMVQQGGVSLNKKKITDPNYTVGISDLLNDKYLLVQKGKKNYFLINV